MKLLSKAKVIPATGKWEQFAVSAQPVGTNLLIHKATKLPSDAFLVAIKRIVIRSTDKGEWFDSQNLILFYQFSKIVTKSHGPFLRGYPEFIVKDTTFENTCC